MTDDRSRRERRFWAPDVRQDVDDELAHHLEMREREFEARGLSPVEAREAARRKFGNAERIAADCRHIDERRYREERRASMWNDFRQDVAYGVRLLGRTPGFTAVAVLTLALGIGATTAIFSLANWTLLRPVPGVTSPEDVGVAWSGRWTDEGSSFTPSRISYPNLADITARLTTVSGIAAYQGGSINVEAAGAAARPITVQYTTASYFDVLGVGIRRGRPFTADEDNPGGADHVAVISDRLWATAFDRAPDVLQQSLRINGLPFTIVGVAPPGFQGTERVSDVDVWLPGASYPAVNHMRFRYDSRTEGAFYGFVVRLAPGATWDHARAELQSLGPWLAEQHPAENKRFQEVTLHLMGAIGLPPMPASRAQLRGLLGVMLGASALVLLIACANVAGLLLIRGVGRQSEFAVRRALGAGRLRLVRQQITEGAILWMLGGAAALLTVHLLFKALDVAPLIGLRVPDAQVPLDWRVVGFTLGLSLVVGAAFATLPALRSARARPADVLRAAAPTSTRRSLTAGAALTVVQLSASLALLVGALLMTATVRHLSTVPLGFDPDGLVVFQVDPGRLGYTPATAFTYAREFERRLAGVPGVENVAVAQGAPFQLASYTRVRRQGASGVTDVQEPLFNQIVSASYFDTVGIPLIRGRFFEPADISEPGGRSRPVVIVSATLAVQLFGAADPLGQFVEFPFRGREKAAYEVVGIVGDVRYSDRELTGDIEPVLYEPAGMDGSFRPFNSIIVRAPGRSDLPAEIQRIARDLNPALPVAEAPTVAALVARARAPWSILAWLTGALAALACALAAIGLFGVIGSEVAQRRREFGIRMALGAGPWRLLSLVLRRTLALTILGLATGLLGAYWLAGVLENRLVGVERFDVGVWVLAAALLAGVALAASALPARRAVRVDPVEALRVG